MKQHERRAAGKPATYYKLATWDALNACWNDGKRQYDTQGQARAAATKPGRYRICEVNGGRTDLEPFEVS